LLQDTVLGSGRKVIPGMPRYCYQPLFLCILELAVASFRPSQKPPVVGELFKDIPNLQLLLSPRQPLFRSKFAVSF
jgi:hypothetical protein